MALSYYTHIHNSGSIIRHWYVTSLRTFQDIQHICSGDVLTFKELTFTVTHVHTPSKTEHIFTGILHGKNPWNIETGRSITWGPLGIADSYESYSRRTFIVSKRPVYYYDD